VRPAGNGLIRRSTHCANLAGHFIATVCGLPIVVRKPILVAVDSDQIFQATGDASLLVCLELGMFTNKSQDIGVPRAGIRARPLRGGCEPDACRSRRVMPSFAAMAIQQAV